MFIMVLVVKTKWAKTNKMLNIGNAILNILLNLRPELDFLLSTADTAFFLLNAKCLMLIMVLGGYNETGKNEQNVKNWQGYLKYFDKIVSRA